MHDNELPDYLVPDSHLYAENVRRINKQPLRYASKIPLQQRQIFQRLAALVQPFQERGQLHSDTLIPLPLNPLNTQKFLNVLKSKHMGFTLSI